jgi:hypothetical protein
MARVTMSQRKAISEQKARARQARMLQAKKTGERVIPDGILKKLAALNLPPNEFVYQACLEKLLRGA